MAGAVSPRRWPRRLFVARKEVSFKSFLLFWAMSWGVGNWYNGWRLLQLPIVYYTRTDPLVCDQRVLDDQAASTADHPPLFPLCRLRSEQSRQQR